MAGRKAKRRELFIGELEELSEVATENEGASDPPPKILGKGFRRLVFRELSEREFERFALDCPVKSYMQSPPMYQRYRQIGREAYLVGLVADGRLVMAGLLSQIYARWGRKIFTMSRGPVADFATVPKGQLEEFLSGAKNFARAHGGIVLQVSPSVPAGARIEGLPLKDVLADCGFKYLGEYEQVKWTYVIDFAKVAGLEPRAKAHKISVPLADGELPIDKKKTQATEAKDGTRNEIEAAARAGQSMQDEKMERGEQSVQGKELRQGEQLAQAERILMKSFRENHRHSIRYATERHHLKLRKLAAEEYPEMLQLLEEAGELHGFHPRSLEFYQELAAAFGPEVAAIVAELPDGTPVAAGFFVLYGDEVIYLYSGLSREHGRLCGPHLIQWEMIKYAYNNGFRRYNFWGTHPNPEDGVFQFKQGFRGEVEELIGTFAAPLSTLGRAYLAKIRPAEQRDLG